MGVGFPTSVIVGSYGFAVVGEKEIDFKDSVTELIVEKKSFVGIRVSVAQNTAESVSDVRMLLCPRIVKRLV